ncbi:MAG: hypothetical protein ABL917_00065 [Parcubacteria group bacterium]
MKKSTSKTQKINKADGIPLAVVSVPPGVILLQKIENKSTSTLFLSWSTNGVDFIVDPGKVGIKTISRKTENIKDCYNFSISKTPNGFVMTYFRKAGLRTKEKLIVARSKDLYDWEIKSELPANDSKHATVVYDKAKDRFEMYRDGLFIRNQASISLSVWKEKQSLTFTSRVGYFDSENITIIGGTITNDGILILYDASSEQGSKTLIQMGGVVFGMNDPRRVIWRSNLPIWQGVVDSKDETRPIKPLGFANMHNHLMLYWVTHENDLIVIKIPSLYKEAEDFRRHPKIMERHESNPIIEPIRGSVWENEGTFNPAVVEDDEGDIHVLYRAVGGDGISRVGYAKSKDGVNISGRLPYPVYEASRNYGMPNPDTIPGPLSYNPYMYVSGGSWGGAEDPRAVVIGDRVYMVYTAFEGWNSMRMALTSISLEDFKAGRWTWKKPKLISSPKNRSKNWLIFPEKINGKFAVLHSISPRVLVDYVDDLDTFDDIIYSPRPEGPQHGRKDSWDHLLKGSGPPPLKTSLGWLLLYHALEKHSEDKYRLGAMILDKNDPTKILYRSDHPLLSPDMHYENDSKPGVVYASGALIRGDDLYVYYGGGDKYCCVAKTPLSKLLKYLQTGDVKPYHLEEVKAKKEVKKKSKVAEKKKVKSKVKKTKAKVKSKKK